MSEKISPDDMGFDEVINRLARANPEDLPESFESDGKAKPFVKWAGGKRQLLDVLSAKIPSKFEAYHEPFLGGGALFWRLAPKRAVLSDSNLDLIITYKVVQKNPGKLIESLRNHKENHDKDYYEAYRKIRNYQIVSVI